MTKKKLFMIYVGGTHEKALIELHDIRFAVAERIEDAYEMLRKSWWGKPESLHLDAWGSVEYVEHYRVHLSSEVSQDPNKLYFVNLGGYDANQFTELHKNMLVVAQDEVKAKQKALQFISEWEAPHRDNLHAVEHLIEVSAHVLADQSYYIHLEEVSEMQPFQFTCRYTPIGKVN